MKPDEFSNFETAWCPGCGNFAILDTLTKVLNEMDITPSKVMLVGGIGQAAKTNQYISANGFSGLHGRALPAAVAMKMVNRELTVIVNSGDGDSYGEGGNHFLHTIRRNIDITHFVHNNQIYGLTKGQTSPTTNACSVTGSKVACNMNVPFNPMLMAIAAGATFVARTFSGKKEHMATIMKAAINHKGYALVDILQPCISFNKVNTYTYYNQKVYELSDDYDKSNKLMALEKSMEFDVRIPIGILYQEETMNYQEKRKELYEGLPLIDRDFPKEQLEKLIKNFV